MKMADVFTREKRSHVMSRIRSRDTKPEMLIRKGLHRLGYRFRLHDKRLPEKPDLVLRRYRTAIQVRGCFWHSHDCNDGHIPKSRQHYWKPKLEANKNRDAKNDAALESMGWKVMIIWECSCSYHQIQRYRSIISGPLMDRLDIHMEVSPFISRTFHWLKEGNHPPEFQKRSLRRGKFRPIAFKR